MSRSATRPGWLPIALSVGCALAAMVALTLVLGRADARYALSSEAEHAIGHAVLTLPLLALVGAAIWLWPAPRPLPTAVRARRIIVAGLAVVSAGQLFEAAGALAFDGDERARPTLAILHDLGVVGGPAGLLIVGGGIALALRRPTAAPGAMDVAIGSLAFIGIASTFVGLTPLVAVLMICTAVVLVAVRRRAARNA